MLVKEARRRLRRGGDWRPLLRTWTITRRGLKHRPAYITDYPEKRRARLAQRGIVDIHNDSRLPWGRMRPSSTTA
jgi:hypothetical protein